MQNLNFNHRGQKQEANAAVAAQGAKGKKKEILVFFAFCAAKQRDKSIKFIKSPCLLFAIAKKLPIGLILCGLFFFISCGSKKNSTKAQKKIEITITGLDGNGIAEKKITDDLMGMEGVKTISFNYLANQVVVLFDTNVVKQSDIISSIMRSDEGKHKVLDVKTNNEPIKNIPPVKPDPQEDIHDDTGDRYKDNG